MVPTNSFFHFVFRNPKDLGKVRVAPLSLGFSSFFVSDFWNEGFSIISSLFYFICLFGAFLGCVKQLSSLASGCT